MAQVYNYHYISYPDGVLLFLVRFKSAAQLLNTGNDVRFRILDFAFYISVILPYYHMEVEYQVDRNEYLEFYRLFLKDRFRKRIVFISLLFFLFVFAVCSGNFTWTKCLIAVGLYPFFIAIVTYYLPLLIIMNNTDKKNSQGKLYTGKRTLSIIDDGIVLTIGNKPTLIG